MAIFLEFIDFVVPIEKIRLKYPGGWDQCLLDHSNLIGGRVWYDEYLFRDGAMNPGDIKRLVSKWAELGFEPAGSNKDGDFWKDCCVVESMFSGPTLPCDWLVLDPDRQVAYLAGTEPGQTKGRDDVSADHEERS